MDSNQFSQYIEASDGETASEAIKRYQEFQKAAEESGLVADNKIDQDTWVRNCALRTSVSSVSDADLKEMESRLGVALPEIYKDFLKEHGEMEIGKNSHNLWFLNPREVRSLATILSDDYGMDPQEEFDLDESGVGFLSKGIHFCYGDSDTYYLFRVDGESDGEMPIIASDDNEHEYSARPLDQVGAVATFNQFVSGYITRFVTSTAEDLIHKTYACN